MISVDKVRIVQGVNVSTGSVRVISDASVAKTGYVAIGAVSICFENGSGSNATYCFCSQISFDKANQTVTASARASGTSASNIDIYAIVIYEKL
jgi:hypothetical protein